MPQTILLFGIFLIFLQYTKAQEAYGFDFQDNKVPKYLTEENGVAEVRIKVREGFKKCREVSLTRRQHIYDFFPKIQGSNSRCFLKRFATIWPINKRVQSPSN